MSNVVDVISTRSHKRRDLLGVSMRGEFYRELVRRETIIR